MAKVTLPPGSTGSETGEGAGCSLAVRWGRILEEIRLLLDDWEHPLPRKNGLENGTSSVLDNLPEMKIAVGWRSEQAREQGTVTMNFPWLTPEDAPEITPTGTEGTGLLQ